MSSVSSTLPAGSHFIITPQGGDCPHCTDAETEVCSAGEVACLWSCSWPEAGLQVTSGQTHFRVPLFVMGEEMASEVAGVLAQPPWGLGQISLPPSASGPCTTGDGFWFRVNAIKHGKIPCPHLECGRCPRRRNASLTCSPACGRGRVGPVLWVCSFFLFATSVSLYFIGFSHYTK